MFPRTFMISHFFDLSRLLHKKAECGEGSDSISVTKEADDGNQNRNVRQKKSEAASGTTAHSLPPNGGEGSDSISVTKEAAHPQNGMRGFFGADDGNRTRVFGLGSGHSAIELHLQLLLSYYTPKLPVCQEKTGHFFENALFFCFM